METTDLGIHFGVYFGYAKGLQDYYLLILKNFDQFKKARNQIASSTFIQQRARIEVEFYPCSV